MKKNLVVFFLLICSLELPRVKWIAWGELQSCQKRFILKNYWNNVYMCSLMAVLLVFIRSNTNKSTPHTSKSLRTSIKCLLSGCLQNVKHLGKAYSCHKISFSKHKSIKTKLVAKTWWILVSGLHFYTANWYTVHSLVCIVAQWDCLWYRLVPQPTSHKYSSDYFIICSDT